MAPMHVPPEMPHDPPEAVEPAVGRIAVRIVRQPLPARHGRLIGLDDHRCSHVGVLGESRGPAGVGGDVVQPTQRIADPAGATVVVYLAGVGNATGDTPRTRAPRATAMAAPRVVGGVPSGRGSARSVRLSDLRMRQDPPEPRPVSARNREHGTATGYWVAGEVRAAMNRAESRNSAPPSAVRRA